MQLTDHQIQLSAINNTLIPDNFDVSARKIGIFLSGQNGDLITAMSILKYRTELFPGKKIIWFCNMPVADALKFAPISEVREYRWDGLETDPWTQLRTKDGKSRLDQEKKHKFDWSKDLDDGFFPAPWHFSEGERLNIEYPNYSKRVFGVDPSWEWHPYLSFSNEEREVIREFCLKLPYKKTIMIENHATSGQTGWNDPTLPCDKDFTTNTIRICREKWGSCNFIFASRTNNSKFLNEEGAVSASHFTVRQTALINNYADLFVGVSSGISVATSCWGNKPTPKIQFCNSLTCSTVALANGPIELVAPDDYQNTLVGEEKISSLYDTYQLKLTQLINKFS